MYFFSRGDVMVLIKDFEVEAFAALAALDFNGLLRLLRGLFVFWRDLEIDLELEPLLVPPIRLGLRSGVE